MLSDSRIPLNKQSPGAVGGLEIHKLPDKNTVARHELSDDHRDDYYILGIITKGEGIMSCDMTEIHMRENGLAILKPLQVHSVNQISEQAEGWFVSIAPFLIPDRCVSIFRELKVDQQFVPLETAEQQTLVAMLELLHNAFREEHPHKLFILKGLLDAIVNRVAAVFTAPETGVNEPKSQARLLTDQFRQLLAAHSFLKPPAFFAEQLHVTTAHLNDSAKAATGYSVTYWLQDAMVLEAKRHLYYTDKSVKEVAYALGFEDPAYFSRLFRKITGKTPLDFRREFCG